MKRGEIYFSKYRDALGRDRKMPALVISNNEYNKSSEYATIVKLSRRLNGPPMPHHVFIPADAFANTSIPLADCYALIDTVSSVKRANMEGPIGVLASPYYMNMVERALETQIGVSPYESQKAQGVPPVTDRTHEQTKPAPIWYSAAASPQMRETKQAEE